MAVSPSRDSPSSHVNLQLSEWRTPSLPQPGLRSDTNPAIQEREKLEISKLLQIASVISKALEQVRLGSDEQEETEWKSYIKRLATVVMGWTSESETFSHDAGSILGSASKPGHHLGIRHVERQLLVGSSLIETYCGVHCQTPRRRPKGEDLHAEPFLIEGSDSAELQLERINDAASFLWSGQE